MGAPGTAAYYEDRDRRNRHRYARQSIGADALSGAAYLLEGLGDWRRQRQKDADEEATAQLFSQMMASPEGVPLAEGESGPNVSWNQALAERSGQYRAPGFLDKLGQTFVGGYEGQVRPTQAMGLQQMYAQMQAQQREAGHQQEMRGFERARVGLEGERVDIARNAEEREKAEAAAQGVLKLRELEVSKQKALVEAQGHAATRKETKRHNIATEGAGARDDEFKGAKELRDSVAGRIAARKPTIDSYEKASAGLSTLQQALSQIQNPSKGMSFADLASSYGLAAAQGDEAAGIAASAMAGLDNVAPEDRAARFALAQKTLTDAMQSQLSLRTRTHNAYVDAVIGNARESPETDRAFREFALKYIADNGIDMNDVSRQKEIEQAFLQQYFAGGR